MRRLNDRLARQAGSQHGPLGAPHFDCTQGPTGPVTSDGCPHWAWAAPKEPMFAP